MDLRYRLAVVTGAGGGLGREIAVALGRVGAAVLSVDRELAGAEETTARVRTSRVSAWALQADLTEEAELQLVADRARDLGGMDLLVTCADGWTPGDQWPAATPVAWSRTLDLDLPAPMRLTQLFVAGLEERRGRRDGTPAVVNVGPSAGSVSGAAYGSPEYAAAEAGLVRFTTGLADAGSTAGARVMAVVPGLPPLIPPGEVTKVVVDLLREGAAGQVVELTGDHEARAGA